MTRKKKASKGNNQQNGAAVARQPATIMAPLGPSSTLSVIPRQTQFRQLRVKVSNIQDFAVEAVPSTSANQVYGPVGVSFADLSLAWSSTDFYTTAANTPMRDWDQYSLSKVEVYAYLLSATRSSVRVHTAVDVDDDSVIDWQEMRRRQNASIAVLREPTNPMQLIASFAPYPDYRASNTGGDMNNRVGKPNTMFDTEAINQPFVGLKIHMEADTVSGSNPRVCFHTVGHFHFKGRLF